MRGLTPLEAYLLREECLPPPADAPRGPLSDEEQEAMQGLWRRALIVPVDPDEDGRVFGQRTAAGDLALRIHALVGGGG